MKRLFSQYITLFTSLLSHIQFCVKEASGTINRNFPYKEKKRQTLTLHDSAERRVLDDLQTVT